MKKLQKVTRVKLDVGQEKDYILFGLVSSEPDYKLSLSLNRKFTISLKNISALKLADDQSFSRFSNNSGDEVTYILISNRSGKHYFLNKLKNIDFLLQIQVSPDDFDSDKAIAQLREIKTLTAVFRIDTETLKDKNLHYLLH
jgi:predicted nucleic acid-binding Zn finger protein